MSTLFWFFFSEEIAPLVIVLIGLGIITGIVSRQTAFRTLAGIILVLLMTPFLPMVIDLMPLWLLLLVAVFFAMSLFRAVLSVGLGRMAADHTVGILAADAIRMGFRILFWPVRITFAGLRALLSDRGQR